MSLSERIASKASTIVHQIEVKIVLALGKKILKALYALSHLPAATLRVTLLLSSYCLAALIGLVTLYSPKQNKRRCQGFR